MQCLPCSVEFHVIFVQVCPLPLHKEARMKPPDFHISFTNFSVWFDPITLLLH